MTRWETEVKLRGPVLRGILRRADAASDEYSRPLRACRATATGIQSPTDPRRPVTERVGPLPPGGMRAGTEPGFAFAAGCQRDGATVGCKRRRRASGDVSRLLLEPPLTEISSRPTAVGRRTVIGNADGSDRARIANLDSCRTRGISHSWHKICAPRKYSPRLRLHSPASPPDCDRSF